MQIFTIIIFHYYLLMVRAFLKFNYKIIPFIKSLFVLFQMYFISINSRILKHF